MMIPTIHSNGTSKERLLEDIEDAYEVLGKALNRLAETAPNDRDYYPQGNGALEKAQSEHCERVQKLIDVRKDLEA